MALQSLFELSHWNARIIDGSTAIAPQGIITGMTLPTIEREMDTTKRAGELGVVPRPSFFNETELTFSVKNIFAEFLTAVAAGLSKSIEIEATACIIPDSGTPKAYKVNAKGFISSFPMGDLTADGIEVEYTMMCWYVKAVIGTTYEMTYDPRNYLLSLNGTNLFADVKSIIEPPPAA